MGFFENFNRPRVSQEELEKSEAREAAEVEDKMRDNIAKMTENYVAEEKDDVLDFELIPKEREVFSAERRSANEAFGDSSLTMEDRSAVHKKDAA